MIYTNYAYNGSIRIVINPRIFYFVRTKVFRFFSRYVDFSKDPQYVDFAVENSKYLVLPLEFSVTFSKRKIRIDAT